MKHKIRIAILSCYYKLKYCKSLSLSGFHNLAFDTSISITNKGNIFIDKRMTTYRGVSISVNGGTLFIGHDVFFNRNCNIVSQDRIDIGNNCIFGPNVVIVDHDHVFDVSGVRREKFNRKPIIIEDNCWIGANAVILRGAIIGEGSIVGAGTVIKGKIPKHSLVTGERTMRIQDIENRCQVMKSQGGKG